MTAEQYHWLVMFRHMPSVYSSGPVKPGGTTSGQRPGPSRFEKSASTPADVMLRFVMVVVIGQFCKPTGELSTIELVSVSFWFGIGVPGVEGGGVVTADGGVVKDTIDENRLEWVGSAPRAR